jgi:hypothetical protein
MGRNPDNMKVDQIRFQLNRFATSKGAAESEVPEGVMQALGIVEQPTPAETPPTPRRPGRPRGTNTGRRQPRTPRTPVVSEEDINGIRLGVLQINQNVESLREETASLRSDVTTLQERESAREEAARQPSEPTPTPVAATEQVEEPDRQAISEEPQGPTDQTSGETPEGGVSVVTTPREEPREPDREEPRGAPPTPPGQPVPAQATATATNNGGALGWGLALLGLFLALGLGAIALALVLRDDDNGNGTAVVDPGSKFAAETFGGNARDWVVIEGSGGSGWKYTGSAEVEFDIPSGYRIDYPGATCEVPGSSGVYGPVKIKRGGPVSVWRVGSETKCPAQAGGSGQPPASDQANQPPAPVSPPSGGQTSAPSGSFQLGCTGKDVGAVQALIGLNVVCLGTEYDAYTWRSVPLVVDGVCPDGWICTLHLQDDRVVVVRGNGNKYAIKAGTFRRLSGYPASDAVHNACALLTKEQVFGASQTPSFNVEAMGFSCQNGQVVEAQAAAPPPAQAAAPPPARQAPAPPAQPPAPPANPCPRNEAQASSLLGGVGWKLMPNTDGTGWKYGPGAAPATITAPNFGRVDYVGGSLRNGQNASGVTDATFWCAG